MHQTCCKRLLSIKLELSQEDHLALRTQTLDLGCIRLNWITQHRSTGLQVDQRIIMMRKYLGLGLTIHLQSWFLRKLLITVLVHLQRWTKTKQQGE